MGPYTALWCSSSHRAATPTAAIVTIIRPSNATATFPLFFGGSTRKEEGALASGAPSASHMTRVTNASPSGRSPVLLGLRAKRRLVATSKLVATFATAARLSQSSLIPAAAFAQAFSATSLAQIGTGLWRGPLKCRGR